MKLSPVMLALVDDAPTDWQPTPPGYLPCLRVLEHRRLVEVQPAIEGRPGHLVGWQWRRRPAGRRRA